MENINHLKTDRLSNKNLWTYAAGGIGRDMAYSMWNGYLLVCIMYTKDVTTRQLSIILLMMTLCRIWDAVNDPVMGGIIERTRSRFGKFKPYIFIGALSNALVMFSIFAAPLTGKQFVIFFPFAYLIWDITFTMNDIGYWAMLPSLTSNDQDRNKLTTWANILAGIGSGLAGIIIPTFTTGSMAIGGTAVTGFKVMAVVIGGVFIGCQSMTCACVKEKPLPPIADGEKVGIKQMFNVIFKNDQLLWIALVMILYNLGSSLYYASTANFVYFRFGYEGGNAAIFGTLGGLLGGVSILYPMFAKRFTRRQISRFAVLLAACGYALFFLVGSSTIAASNTKLIFVFLILSSAIIVCGQTMFYMVQTISIANTIEYNEWKTGSRDEGIIFSVRPFMAKMGSALVALTQVFVYGVWRGKNGKAVADYTNAISNIENQATKVLAGETGINTAGGIVAADPESAQGLFQDLVSKAGMSFGEAQSQVVAAGDTGTFGEVIGKLKAVAIDNTLSSVENGAIVWMLLCLTIIPMVFVILGYIVWSRKFKIDEKAYAEMVNDIEERRAAATVTATDTDVEAVVTEDIAESVVDDATQKATDDIE